jgi:hypothetical protein
VPIIFGVIASPALASELAWLVEDGVERAMRVDGWRPGDEVHRFVADLRSLAQTYREAEASRHVASNVASATAQTSRPGTVVYMTTREIAEAQDVTVAAVAARCRRRAVPGAVQTNRGWRIPASYLRSDQ